MAQYRTHVRLSLPENTSEAILDRRAIKNLHLITVGAAAESLDLILSSDLEWRPEQQLAALRTRGEQVTITPPRTWKDWVTAMTTLFAPANRIALLARDVMTLQAKPKESVDLFSIRVSRAYSRLLAEAERTAPPNVSAYEHAFNKAKIASFENGLQPEIRVEMVREDASQTFMASTTRARKHEANKLRSASSQSSASVSAASHPQLETVSGDHEKRLAALEERLRANLTDQVSSASSRGSATYNKRSSSTNGKSRESSKRKVAASRNDEDSSSDDDERPCNYAACVGRKKAEGHSRRNYRTEQADLERGIVLTAKAVKPQSKSKKKKH